MESVAVEDTAVVLTTSHWLKDNITYTLAYTPGVRRIMDPVGNAVAAFEDTFSSFAVSQPVLRGATVTGTKLVLSMVHALDPASVPQPSAFGVWEKEPEVGETGPAGALQPHHLCLVNCLDRGAAVERPGVPVRRRDGVPGELPSAAHGPASRRLAGGARRNGRRTGGKATRPTMRW